MSAVLGVSDKELSLWLSGGGDKNNGTLLTVPFELVR